MRLAAIWLAAVLALAAAGCATATRETRIARHRALFAQYPPEIQREIRAGEVEPGFTRDMVELALGKPDRVIERENANGVLVLWAWTAVRQETPNDPSFWLDDPPVYDKTRVFFMNGVVTVVEGVWAPAQRPRRLRVARLER